MSGNGGALNMQRQTMKEMQTSGLYKRGLSKIYQNIHFSTYSIEILAKDTHILPHISQLKRFNIVFMSVIYISKA